MISIKEKITLVISVDTGSGAKDNASERLIYD
jgi:hypothetical protein